jgi:hypothetical protein
MMTACGKVGTQRFDTKRVQSANLVSGSNECNGGREMQSFLGTLRKAPGYVALIIAVAMSTTAALTAAIVVSSLVGRVEKLESDLARTQTKLVELTAAQSRLSASIDTADRSIKSLRSDLDHPRVRPLASIANSGPFPRQ